jgi:hypothetical protein
VEALATQLAQTVPADIEGTWQRHVPARLLDNPLVGRSAAGRWGTDGGNPVLYLGQPTESVVVEAYRHLIEPVVTEGQPAPPIRPRAVVTCEVTVTTVLDLRSAANRVLANLTLAQLQSETWDRGAYSACQKVAAVAHELGYHAIIAPAATKMGQTLALFTDLLRDSERPRLTATQMWVELPPDPRKAPGPQ